MSDHQPPIIKYIMAHQTVQEGRDTLFERGRFLLQLCQRLSYTMCKLYVMAFELAQQLDIVITRNTESRTTCHQIHRKAQHSRSRRTTIHQITQKHDLPPLRMPHLEWLIPYLRCYHLIPKLTQNLLQLVKTAVDITDNIKRPMLISPIIP